MILFNDILKSLFPKSLAFRFFNGTFLQKLITALSKEPDRIKLFFDKVRSSGIPDCDILPYESLSDWETFLNIQKNSVLTDEQRCKRIEGKYVSQGGQGPDYIQDVLQSAGFPVYVFENIVSGDPSFRNYTSRLGGLSLGESFLGAYTDRIDPRNVDGLLIPGAPEWVTNKIYEATMGGYSLGEGSLGDYIGTYTSEIERTIPSTPDKFVFIWFLCGKNGLNNFVDIPLEQREDFIKTVIQIKPSHTWALAQVNFI